MTRPIGEILDNEGNLDDLIALFTDKNLPIDEIGARDLGLEVMNLRPEIGYLTISNAL